MNQKKLLVFVSSTYNDLKEERQAAVQAILKAGHIPAGMELFTSGDKSQLETINDWIDESDVYMLILGGRYGSLEPTSNVSYTELEYDYAKSAGKPCFVVVISENALDKKVKEHGKVVIEQENPTQLKQFREKVLSSICSFFDEVKDVKLCVYESLGGYSRDPNLSGWVSGKKIPDISSMTHELNELRLENEQLRNKVETNVRLPKSETDEYHSELEEILSRIEIKIPGELTAENTLEVKTASLHDILIKNSDILITGVTNSPFSEAAETFFYFNIAPKLQVHGLMESEKVTGAKYRRYYLTKEGQKYVSWIARNAVHGIK